MSYSFTLRFKKVDNELQVLNIISEFQRSLLNENNFKDLLKTSYLESLLANKNVDVAKIFSENITDIPVSTFNNAYTSIENYIKDLLNYSIFYWPDYNLLGIISKGFDEPEFIKRVFDIKIDFQNNCDQNYDYDTWKPLGVFTKKIIKDVLKKSPAEVMAEDFGILPSELTETDLADAANNLDYYQKTVVYNRIVKQLDILLIDYANIGTIKTAYIPLNISNNILFYKHRYIAIVVDYIKDYISQHEYLKG